MWPPPLIYAIVSLLLWQFAHAIFMPELITNRIILATEATEPLVRQVVLANVAVFYFAGYWLFSANWSRLKPYLGNAFLGALALWGVNTLILFPLIGRGIFGYKLPQGAYSPCLWLAATHWIFARMLQMSASRFLNRGSEPATYLRSGTRDAAPGASGHPQK